MYLISACLLGDNCKYNGGNNANEKVIEFAKTHSYMKVCPEVAGGLPTPRPPAEIQHRPAEIQHRLEEIQCRPDEAYCKCRPDQAAIKSASNDQTETTCYKICNVEGADVTTNFLNGAKICLEKALAEADSYREGQTPSHGKELKGQTPQRGTQRGTEIGEQIEGAILKAKSPSCGSGLIYDGTFSGTLIEGDGVFAAELKKINIKVITEKDL